MKDSIRWEEEKESKTTLELYSRCKKKIGEEQIYENEFNSVLVYRCRSNTLKLKWRNRFAGGDERCDLYVEDLRWRRWSTSCLTVSLWRRCGGRGECRESLWRRCCCLRWGDGRCIGDLRNYIGELWRRRKQLMSSVRTGGGGFLEGTRWRRSKGEQEEGSEQWKKYRSN